jgi:hypothetical protein
MMHPYMHSWCCDNTISSIRISYLENEGSVGKESAYLAKVVKLSDKRSYFIESVFNILILATSQQAIR